MKRRMIVLTSTRLAAAALQAVALVVLARTTDVHEFGAFSIVFAVQSTVFTIGSLGLQGFVLRERARGRLTLVRGALRLNRFSSFAAALIALSSTAGVRQEAVGLSIVVGLAAAFVLEKNAGVVQSVLIAEGRTLRPSVSVVLVPLITMTFVVAGPFADAPLSYSVGRLVGAAAGMLCMLRSTGSVARDGRPDRLVATLLEVWPLAINGIVTTAVTFDTAIVGGIGGKAQAAYYSAASKVIAPLAIGTSSVSTVLMPHAAVVDEAGARRLRAAILKIGLLTAVVAVPLSLVAPGLVVALFGPTYDGAGVVLMALIWAVPSLTVGPLLETYLQGTGRERAVAVIAVVYSVASIIGAAVGSITLGAFGAAISVAVLNLLKVVVQSTVRPRSEPPSESSGPSSENDERVGREEQTLVDDARRQVDPTLAGVAH